MKLPGFSIPALRTGSVPAPTDGYTRTDSPDASQTLDRLGLKNGETVAARVASVLRQGDTAEELLLELRGRTLKVRAFIGDTRLSAGDWIRLLRNGQELRLEGRLAGNTEALTQALIQRLPWQHRLDTGLTRLIRALGEGIRYPTPPGQLPSAQSLQPLPAPARAALEQILAGLPGPGRLPPGSGSTDAGMQLIRQWLQNSGLFAESRLARNGEAPVTDLKLALVRVATALLTEQGQSPDTFRQLTPLASPELLQAPLQFPRSSPAATATGSSEPLSLAQTLRLLAGLLNRISSQQLHSQLLSSGGTETGAATNTLLLELPWLNTQQEARLAQLRLEYTDRGGDKDEGGSRRASTSEWRMTLALDLDHAGPVQFDVALRTGQVDTCIWAGKASTLLRIQQELPRLQQGLTALGLEVTGLEARQGQPPGPPETRIEHRLVDTRA